MPANPKTPMETKDLGNGQFITFFYDGSSTIFNTAGQVVKENPDPNPSLAAAIGAGRLDDAALTAVQGSDEDARRFNATLQWQQDQVKNTYRTNLMNARTQADQQAATAEYQRAQVDLAKQRLDFDRKKHDDDFGLSQAKLGYDLIGTAANLRGPENYFAASNYARGVAGQPGTAGFLSALQSNAKLAGFGAQSGVPQAETLGTITARLQGGAAPGIGSYHRQIQDIGAAGAHKLGAGSLEQLSPMEMKLFTGGLETADDRGVAFDASTFLDQYRRSRIGNSGNYRAA
jgi:hypothetical protein